MATPDLIILPIASPVAAVRTSFLAASTARVSLLIAYPSANMLSSSSNTDVPRRSDVAHAPPMDWRRALTSDRVAVDRRADDAGAAINRHGEWRNQCDRASDG
jgi:hypothetical protein